MPAGATERGQGLQTSPLREQIREQIPPGSPLPRGKREAGRKGGTEEPSRRARGRGAPSPPAPPRSLRGGTVTPPQPCWGGQRRIPWCSAPGGRGERDGGRERRRREAALPAQTLRSLLLFFVLLLLRRGFSSPPRRWRRPCPQRGECRRRALPGEGAGEAAPIYITGRGRRGEAASPSVSTAPGSGSGGGSAGKGRSSLVPPVPVSPGRGCRGHRGAGDTGRWAGGLCGQSRFPSREGRMGRGWKRRRLRGAVICCPACPIPHPGGSGRPLRPARPAAPAGPTGCVGRRRGGAGRSAK